MRIVVLHGAEPFFRSLHTTRLREQLAEEHGEIETVRFDGESCSAAEVLDECRSWSLLQQHKLVLVDAADQIVKEANRKLFERYAEAPSEDATLVLRSDTWRKGKLDKLIDTCGGGIIKCDHPTSAEATKWAINRCRSEWDAEIEADAARLLIDRLGVDMGRIDTELSKLASAISEGASISLALVRDMVGMSREEEVWAIQSRLLTGDPEIALRSLNETLDVSRQPEVLVSYAVIDLARKLHTAASLIQGGMQPFNAAREAKIWGPAQQPILALASRAAPAKFAALLDDAVEADARMKSGRTSPRRSLEALALRFASL